MSKKNEQKDLIKNAFEHGQANAGMPQDSNELQSSSVYLEYIKMTNFGKFANTIVGPFKPGLNVVYGPNESGKTTLNELIKGILFGWPSARKGVNSYKPEGSERVGSLFFKDKKSNEVTEVKRTKNNAEIEDEFHVREDIDKETFSTMFALTSEELMQLDKHNEITARLLTAGSGTSASPAKTLETINQRIKEKMSRASANDHSIANLKAQKAQLTERVQEGLQEAEHFRSQEKHLETLMPRKEALLDAQNTLNSAVETYKANLVNAKSLDQAIQDTEQKLEDAEKSKELMAQASNGQFDEEIFSLSELTQEEEYRLRDYLDDKEEQRIKYEHSVENARSNAQKSQIEYELLKEKYSASEEHRRVKAQRRIKLAIAIIIPAIMALGGIYLLSFARQVLRLSYLMLGIGMLIGAVTIAAVGILIILRPTKLEEHNTDELNKAEWVMKQDAKHLLKTEQEEANFNETLKNYLDTHHMKGALGSIKRARQMLDRAQQYRSQKEASLQNKQALELQLSSLRRSLGQLRQQRASLYQTMGLSPDSQASDIEALIKQKEEERSTTIKLSNETHRQFGEISQELQQAQFKQELNQAKQDLEVIEACLLTEYRDLARLLLAKQALEIAIAEWEKKSQPEVYRRASFLLDRMTQGVWQEVRMNAQGEIEVIDALKTARLPQFLSLGTRQQLYLSLRISLLMMSENVGKAMPVLCDDILVNFDEKRRVGAAQALFDLSQYRQVVVFTCHPEVVSLMQAVDSSLNFIEL